MPVCRLGGALGLSERGARKVGGVAEGVMGAVVWGVVLGPVMGRGVVWRGIEL